MPACGTTTSWYGMAYALRPEYPEYPDTESLAKTRTVLETVVATETFDAGAAAAAATDVLELTVSPLIVATTGATGEADCRTTVWGLVPTDSEATIWLFAEVAETFFEDVVLHWQWRGLLPKESLEDEA